MLRRIVSETITTMINIKYMSNDSNIIKIEQKLTTTNTIKRTKLETTTVRVE
jgi:hypothetical protein